MTNSAGTDAVWCCDCALQVAGTVGGSTYGVAKLATLVAVRVLDCSGSGSIASVINGINWVVADASTPVRACVRACAVMRANDTRRPCVSATSTLIAWVSRCCWLVVS